MNHSVEAIFTGTSFDENYFTVDNLKVRLTLYPDTTWRHTFNIDLQDELAFSFISRGIPGDISKLKINIDGSTKKEYDLVFPLDGGYLSKVDVIDI